MVQHINLFPLYYTLLAILKYDRYFGKKNICCEMLIVNVLVLRIKLVREPEFKTD